MEAGSNREVGRLPGGRAWPLVGAGSAWGAEACRSKGRGEEGEGRGDTCEEAAQGGRGSHA